MFDGGKSDGSRASVRLSNESRRDNVTLFPLIINVRAVWKLCHAVARSVKRARFTVAQIRRAEKDRRRCLFAPRRVAEQYTGEYGNYSCQP